MEKTKVRSLTTQTTAFTVHRSFSPEDQKLTLKNYDDTRELISKESLDDSTSISEKLTSRFCNHFSIIPSRLAEKMEFKRMRGLEQKI